MCGYTVFNIGDEVWTTKNGTKIKYRDLELAHIKNIAKKTFVMRFGDCDEVGKPLFYDEEEYDYSEMMQLELERRVICRTLGIEL